MIFVGVGTEQFPFDRLIHAVDEAAASLNGEPIVVQLGHSRYVPTRCQWRRFLPYQELVETIRTARLVVTHAGAGLLVLCLQAGQVPLVVPRRKAFGEHVDDHQLELARRLGELGHVVLVEHPGEVAPLLDSAERHHVAPAAQASGQPRLAAALAEHLRTSTAMGTAR